jgi:hypothetical protein
MLEEEMQEEMRDICGGTPCDWEVYGEEVLEDITKIYIEYEEEASNVDNQTIRKSAYNLFVYRKYGHLGKGYRIRTASCVVDCIRENWPNEDGNYTYYYSS